MIQGLSLSSPRLAVLLTAAATIIAMSLIMFDWLGAVGVLVVVAGLVLVAAIFREPLVGLLSIVVALPFERVGALEIAGLTLRASQVLLIVTVFAWLVGGLVRRQLVFRANPLLVPLVVLVVINLLSLTQAVNLQRGVVFLSATILTMLVGLLVPQLVTTVTQAQRVVRVLFAVTLLVTAFGLYQFVGDLIGLSPSLTGLRDLYTKEVFGFPRIQGTASEPLYFVNFLILPISLAVAFVVSRQRTVSTWWLVGLLTLGSLNVVLALSRAGWIAMAVSLLVVGAYYFRKLFRPRQIIIGLIIVVVTAAVFIRVFRLTDDVDLNRGKFFTQATALFEGASFTDRVSTFTDAAASFRAHPWLGIGPGNFGPTVAPFPTIEPEGGWLIVNNIFLEIAAETGIFGLLTFLVIVAILLVRSIKAIIVTDSTWLRAALVGSLAAFVGVIVQYQTFSVLFIMHIWFLFGWLVALQNMTLIKTPS